MSTVQRAYDIRELSLELALRAGTCHIGSALGIADILAVAYVDREQLLREYCQDGGAYGGHAERGVPGVEISGGSLGHGLPIAVGRSLADRLDGRERTTYCLMGDGESDEGSVSEAAALAGRLGLDRLAAIVDANGHQGLEAEHTLDRWERFEARFAAAGWSVVHIDGHDHPALGAALSASPAGRPRLVVAHTIKGRGVSFMEGRFDSHYKSVRPHDRERVMSALREGRIAA
jgi:transketolase